MGSSKKKRGKSHKTTSQSDESRRARGSHRIITAARHPNDVLFEEWAGPGGTNQDHNRSRDSRRIRKAESTTFRGVEWSPQGGVQVVTTMEEMPDFIRDHVTEWFRRVDEFQE